MNVMAVVGLGFGDEGKGLTVASLAKKHNPEETLVVRYSGGQQAGHTVVDGDIKHVFSNFGSASLQGVPTLWAEYCTFDPIGIMVEYKELQEKGITPTLYIDPRCPMTTPYEKEISYENIAHGTCGVGVGNTHQRQADFYKLTAKDMKYPTPFEIKFAMLKNYYSDKTVDKERFSEAVKFIRNCETIHIIDRYDYNIFDFDRKISNIIYESSQGLLLDQHFGFFPHVTRSDLGLKNVYKMNDKLLSSTIFQKIDLYLITRAYQTRHGNGPMTNDNLLNKIEDNVHETNVDNEFQGEFRRSILDLDLLKYAMMSDEYIAKSSKFATLVMTHLDLVDEAWTYTEDDDVCVCSYEAEFVDNIKEALGVNKLIKVRDPKGF